MKTWIKISSLSFLFAANLSSTHANELTPLWQLSDFDQPESVVANKSEHALYVSNINGQPTELNGQGYISKVSLDGNVLDKHWLKNLNAPKGMAIIGDYLYIADMQTVHLASISQAKIIKQFSVKGAKMLNDITIADNGHVYISDLIGGGIYRIADNKISQWYTHESLPHPNGLLWQNNTLLIASWGRGMNNDFSTEHAGNIFSLDTGATKPTLITESEEIGNLDGIVKHNNTIYASDWITGNLFKIEKNKTKKVLSLKPGLADIGINASILFTPSMLDGQVSAWQL